MRLNQYLKEAKMLPGTMIGFKLNQRDFKRVSDYIKSWLDRFKVEYEKTKHLHFSLAQMPGKYPKDELVREMNKIAEEVKFRPKDITIFSGINVKRDFIVLEYKPNVAFLEKFNDIAEKFEVRKFASVRPHVSLFNVEPGALKGDLWEDIKFRLPKLPTVKSIGMELWNNKFEVEFARKV